MLYFVNVFCNVAMLKSVEIVLSKSIFYVKNHWRQSTKYNIFLEAHSFFWLNFGYPRLEQKICADINT